MTPSCVFLDDNGGVKVGNYGISNVLVPCSSYFTNPWYLEEVRRQGQASSSSSDIWNLGITLAHCYLGKLPYKHFRLTSPLLNQEKIINDTTVRNGSFCQFVDICLEKNPLRRASAEELLKTEFLLDETLGQTEVGLEILTRLELRPELRNADVREARDRLDCSQCGEDTGYSVVCCDDVTQFFCDDCLEAKSGHGQDCVNMVEECQVCSSLAETLNQRWRRQESLDQLLRRE